MPTRHYALGGLRVSSALRLPAAEIASSRVDVTVMGGVISDGAEPWPVTGRRYQAAPGRWLFSPGNQLRVLVEHGRSIAYDAPPSMAESTIADCILQPALAALFHQRGLLALHASAVETPAGAVLLLGGSGAGKSTIAARLAAWGNPFISDDVCPIDATPRPSVAGGFVYQKLSRDACQEAGYPYSPAAVIAGDERARVRVRVREQPAGAAPIAHIVLLEQTAAGSPLIERLPAVVATTTLVAHTYRRQYLRGLGTASENLRMCAAVASCIPVARLRYEAGSVDSDTVARLVARHTDARCG
jgi:hypothetical protein